jgi:hypothetical protein
MRRALQAHIFSLIVPTALDRRRMDAIVSGSAAAEAAYDCIERKMVWLRGRGGTAKTVILLHAARRAFVERGHRSLFLTYNHALAADIRRMMSLLKIPSGIEEGGIRVQTVMAFMTGLFRRLGVAAERDAAREADADYVADCRGALEAINVGAVTRADIEVVFNQDPDRFRFDIVAVDEAQDWPQAEADLLKAVYGPLKISIGDGIEQLVRQSTATDWRTHVPDGDIVYFPLTECLRMKRNLCTFANAVAEAAQLQWSIVPNESAGGGRVLILKRPLLETGALQAELTLAAREKGNDPVDFLHCVPSSNIDTRDGIRRSQLGGAFLGRGLEVWDGVDEVRRRDFPRSVEEFRIVHYASCRGLEGWTVVLHGVDEFWHECFDARRRDGPSPSELDSFGNIEEIASSYAWSRVLIAMTRPIDTLVIVLSDPSSAFASTLLKAGAKCLDFVEVYD